MDKVNPVGIAPKHSSQQQKQQQQAGQQTNTRLDDSAQTPTTKEQVHSPILQSELIEFIERMNIMGARKSPQLEFIFDKDRIQMKEYESGELIRILSSEEFLRIAQELHLRGIRLGESPGQWIELNV